MLKKILSVLLAATMVSSLCAVTAMASDEPTVITVEPELLEFVTTKEGETDGVTLNSSFSGGAWINKVSDTIFSYEGEIYAPKAGNYTLETFGYHQKDGANYLSRFSVTINDKEYTKSMMGTPVDLGAPYPQNTLWSSYKTTVSLKEGKNTISMGPVSESTNGYIFAMD